MSATGVRVAWGTGAKFRVSRRDGKVQLGLDVVKLKLYALEFRADVVCDLAAKVVDA
jgi:hypothetical protein